MRVIHVTPWVGRGSFGLGPVVLNLALEQCRAGVEATVWCADSVRDAEWAFASSGLPRDRIRTFPVLGPRRLAFSPGMEHAARILSGSDVHLVHQHGLWSATSRCVVALRQRLRMPTVVAAHGSLQAWALRRSRFRKWVAAIAYERENLLHASCLHAVAAPEVANYRDYGLTNPVAVIPNGISAAWLRSVGDDARFRDAQGLGRDRRILLYLSRIAPIKGLPILLQAMARLGGRLEDWLLVIAGADERGHQADVERLVETLNLGTLVRFVGPLHDQSKRDAFAAADVFVLPSEGDAAPMVVLEALGAGVPVLTTQATPWRHLEQHSCGWSVEATPEGLENGLAVATALNREVLHAMGAKGKSLVSSSFSWSRSAEMTVRLYDWLCGRCDRPEFVLLD